MTFFPTAKSFYDWLEKNHQTQTELLVGFYKVGSGKQSMTWSESVDQALCFGWIDGVRRSVNEVSYSIRFTPRKAGSIWSAVNIDKMAKLTGAKLVQPSGLAAFARRKAENSKMYAYEKEPAVLDASFKNQFTQNKKAWDFFESQPAGYKRTALHFVMSAKQQSTREKRLAELIADSQAGLRLKQLRR